MSTLQTAGVVEVAGDGGDGGDHGERHNHRLMSQVVVGLAADG